MRRLCPFAPAIEARAFARGPSANQTVSAIASIAGPAPADKQRAVKFEAFDTDIIHARALFTRVEIALLIRPASGQINREWARGKARLRSSTLDQRHVARPVPRCVRCSARVWKSGPTRQSSAPPLPPQPAGRLRGRGHRHLVLPLPIPRRSKPVPVRQIPDMRRVRNLPVHAVMRQWLRYQRGREGFRFIFAVVITRRRCVNVVNAPSAALRRYNLNRCRSLAMPRNQPRAS